VQGERRVGGGEETGRSAARHEGETVEGRAEAEQDMGVHQGPAAGRAVLSDVHMLGELRGGPVPVRAERQGGQAVGQVQAERADELRKVQPGHAVLLQNGRPVAGPRQTARVQVRAKSHRMAHRQSKLQVRVLSCARVYVSLYKRNHFAYLHYHHVRKGDLSVRFFEWKNKRRKYLKHILSNGYDFAQ